MTLKTSDLCDACDAALACALPFRGYGRRRAFAGTIRTMRCHEDIALMRDVVNQPGDDQVLVIDGGGSLARAMFGDVMAGMAARNGWAGLVINGAIRDCGGDRRHGHRRQGARYRAASAASAPAPAKWMCPCSFGGITFTPGHRLVADEDGVIVLPAGVVESDIDVDDVVAATAAYAGRERQPR